MLDLLECVLVAATLPIKADIELHEDTQLPMGAKCGKANYFGLWVHCSSLRCRPFELIGIGSRKAYLPPINGW